MNCAKYDYEVEEDAKKHIREMIVSRKLTKTENFANAREVRNLFEEIITNQARRVAKLENPSQEDMKLITMDDLLDLDGEDHDAPEETKEQKEPKEPKISKETKISKEHKTLKVSKESNENKESQETNLEASLQSDKEV